MVEIQLSKTLFYIGMEDVQEKKKCPAKTWVKRFGAAGFIFFLVKGLLWLLVPAVIAYFSLN
jgi:hypothetical protein